MYTNIVITLPRELPGSIAMLLMTPPLANI